MLEQSVFPKFSPLYLNDTSPLNFYIIIYDCEWVPNLSLVPAGW